MNLTFLLFLIKVMTASKIKMTRREPLLYFMSKPEDFENDPDVCFMAVKLHTPAIVEQYYRTAAQTFTDLKHIFKEFAQSREKASKLLEINTKLFEATFVVPLTTANLIFTVGIQLQPLLSYRCPVIDSLAERIKKLEKAGNGTVATINRFFRHFALPEMHFIEILCNLISEAKLLKKPDSSGNFLDFSRTGLLRSKERILLALANTLAKMDMLLALFLTEPSAAERSLNLVKKLWHVHLRRWQLQPDQPPVPTEPSFFDAQSYQKEPIHFTFPDWDQHVDVEKEVALLQIKREKLIKKYEREEALRRMLQRPASSSYSWMFFLLVLGAAILTALTSAFFVIKKQRRIISEEL